MSWKSIRFSIYTILLFCGLLVGIVFLWNIYFVLGIVGIVLLLVFPGMLMRKAIREASGFFDTLFAKYITPGAAAVLGVFIILTMVVWV